MAEIRFFYSFSSSQKIGQEKKVNPAHTRQKTNKIKQITKTTQSIRRTQNREADTMHVLLLAWIIVIH